MEEIEKKVQPPPENCTYHTVVFLRQVSIDCRAGWVQSLIASCTERELRDRATHTCPHASVCLSWGWRSPRSTHRPPTWPADTTFCASWNGGVRGSFRGRNRGLKLHLLHKDVSPKSSSSFPHQCCSVASFCENSCCQIPNNIATHVTEKWCNLVALGGVQLDQPRKEKNS